MRVPRQLTQVWPLDPCLFETIVVQSFEYLWNLHRISDARIHLQTILDDWTTFYLRKIRFYESPETERSVLHDDSKSSSMTLEVWLKEATKKIRSYRNPFVVERFWISSEKDPEIKTLKSKNKEYFWRVPEWPGSLFLSYVNLILPGVR